MGRIGVLRFYLVYIFCSRYFDFERNLFDWWLSQTSPAKIYWLIGFLLNQFNSIPKSRALENLVLIILGIVSCVIDTRSIL